MSRAEFSSGALAVGWGGIARTSAGATPPEAAIGWPPPLHSPDGRLCVRHAGEQLTVFDNATFSPLHRHAMPMRAGGPPPVAWSPDSRILAFARDRQHLSLVDARTGDSIAELSGPLQDAIAALRFTPDRRALILLRDEGVLEMWNLTALAAELAAHSITWDLPPPATPAPQGVPGVFQTAEPLRLYMH